MRVIAIDPSLSGTGLSLLVAGAAPQWSVDTVKIEISKNPDLARAEFGRMESISEAVRQWTIDEMDGERLDLAVIESPAYSRSMGKSHERSGLWWMLYGELVEFKIPVLVVRPNLRAKYATGKGTSSKDEVLLAASRRYPDVAMRNNNEADAVVLAAMGARFLGAPVDSLPKANLDAMNTLISGKG